ncbi:TPA: hypothetical protein I9080_002120 [Clostridium perfringens]|uniref:TNase-like domain-containing protein n=2 Tax=Clostridium perfringens TaxID=1502 RepID=A0A8H9UXT4_CLOPF|nr:thermonuclease family protein [Clostridium perfringens]EDT15784.1 thermonuclease [Clostridium perfringens E str. JGS1987]MCX0408588.1 thermonuclease family protein [Clostridium perfringens]MDU3020163.1 thermonuclease family protein [Clostridium perfringens]HAT4308310.1 hypothetical protein [Clostridium perfringens]
MKKIFALIIGILIIGSTFFLVKERIVSTTKLYIDNESNSTYNDRFDKGYDGKYNKAAVEDANKKHSKVILNKEFKVYGKENVDGATECKYIRDIDGDTIVVDLNGKKTTVRFFGVDTPEDVNPKIHCIEPYSVQAKDYVESKLQSGEIIKILFNDSKGKYGRSVGTIYYEENGKWYDLNEEEVANGLARIAYLDQNNTNIDTKELYAAEESAKNQKLNIWSIDGYATSRGYNLAVFN